MSLRDLLNKSNDPNYFNMLVEYSDEELNRLIALEKVIDFDLLENIVISEEDWRLKARAYDRIKELYPTHKKLKMIDDFLLMTFCVRGWIPIFEGDYRANNNFGRAINWVFDITEDFRIADCVHLLLIPTDQYRWKDISYYNDTKQCFFHLIVKVLVMDYKGDLVHYYYKLKLWTSDQNIHIHKFEDLCYIPEKNNRGSK